jgi:hypothetical protein
MRISRQRTSGGVAIGAARAGGLEFVESSTVRFASGFPVISHERPHEVSANSLPAAFILAHINADHERFLHDYTTIFPAGGSKQMPAL